MRNRVRYTIMVWLSVQDAVILCCKYVWSEWCILYIFFRVLYTCTFVLVSTTPWVEFVNIMSRKFWFIANYMHVFDVKFNFVLPTIYKGIKSEYMNMHDKFSCFPCMGVVLYCVYILYIWQMLSKLTDWKIIAKDFYPMMLKYSTTVYSVL